MVAAVGLGLILAPLAFQMFQRGPEGATMLAEFRPFMSTARLGGFQAEIASVNAAVREAGTSALPYLEAHGYSPSRLATQFPYFQQLSAQWPSIDSTMTGLLDKVQANLGNYQGVAALPSFTLFPWFFLMPGVLLLGLALLGLLRPAFAEPVRWAAMVIGVGLILAPVAFQMFQRAPGGGRMMSAFKTIETSGNVERIQGYFSTMAVGQGDMRLGIVPALQRTGLSQAQIVQQFPAVSALNQGWVHLLNDMTPMIGAMSDNIPNYQAIASLPPFPLFPWFFVLPGLLVVGAASSLGRKRTTEGGLPE